MAKTRRSKLSETRCPELQRTQAAWASVPGARFLGVAVVGWAAVWFEQAKLGDSDAGGPADHTLRNWALGNVSASQAT